MMWSLKLELICHTPNHIITFVCQRYIFMALRNTIYTMMDARTYTINRNQISTIHTHTQVEHIKCWNYNSRVYAKSTRARRPYTIFRSRSETRVVRGMAQRWQLNRARTWRVKRVRGICRWWLTTPCMEVVVGGRAWFNAFPFWLEYCVRQLSKVRDFSRVCMMVNPAFGLATVCVYAGNLTFYI